MAIDVQEFERAIAAEYLRAFADEIATGDMSATVTIMEIAATTAAIALKLYNERLNQDDP